jgi:diacylglycerol kinase family enzyme
MRENRKTYDARVTAPVMSRPPLVVVNPRASRLHGVRDRERLRRELGARLGDRYGVEPDWAPESHAGALEALGDVAGRPLVVAAGGDGTVREAATAAAAHDVPLAIVPGGTGNVLAGTLRLRGLWTSIDVAATGRPRRIDLGWARWGAAGDDTIHERAFTVAAGMGFDARIMALAEGEWKRRLGFGAYIGATVHELARLEPARFRIVADDDSIEIEGLLVLIGNCGDLIPGRIGARQPLDLGDGRLDLFVVGGRGLVDGLRGAIDLLWRTGDSHDHVIRRGVTNVRVEATPAQPLQTDGDHHPPGWLEATVRPGALTVLVPDA